MRKVSLKKLAISVVAAAFVSSYVSAKDDVKQEIGALKSATKSVAPFTKYDADKNGSLSQAEVVAAKNEVLNKAFATLDANGDAAISKEEFAKFSPKHK